MGAQGLYPDRCNSNFNLDCDVPAIVSVWVKLPYLPLHCRNDANSRPIGNSLEKYINSAKLKDSLFAYARVCVVVDLDKGLSATIKLCMDSWSHVQEVDYDQLPFKCKLCHEYEHFANGCPKA